MVYEVEKIGSCQRLEGDEMKKMNKTIPLSLNPHMQLFLRMIGRRRGRKSSEKEEGRKGFAK